MKNENNIDNNNINNDINNIKEEENNINDNYHHKNEKQTNKIIILLNTIINNQQISLFIILFIILLSYMSTEIKFISNSYSFSDIINEFPLLLFSWRVLSWFNPSVLISFIKYTNIIWIITSTFIIYISLDKLTIYCKTKDNSNEINLFIFLLSLAFAIGSSIYYIILNSLDNYNHGLIIMLICIINYLFIVIVMEQYNRIICIITALTCIILICYNPLTCILLLSIAISLIILDSYNDPLFKKSFSFIVSIGIFLIFIVLFLQIIKWLQISDINNNNTNTDIQYAGLFSIFSCIIESCIGNLLSPSRGLLIYSPFFIISFISIICFFLNFQQLKNYKMNSLFLIYSTILSCIVFYIILYSITSCISMNILYINNNSVWNGWWAGNQVGNIQMNIIIPSLILLSSCIFYIPDNIKSILYKILIILLIFTIILHFFYTFSTSYNLLFYWNTKTSYSCYSLSPNSTNINIKPFLILNEDNYELVNNLSKYIHISLKEENINYKDNYWRLWSIKDSPLFYLLFNLYSYNHKYNNNNKEVIESQFHEYCLNNLHLQLQKEEEELKNKLRELQSTIGNKNRNIYNNNNNNDNTISNKQNDINNIQIETNNNNITLNDIYLKNSIPIINILYIGSDGRYNRGDYMLLQDFQDKITKIFKNKYFGINITPIRSFPTSDPVLSPCISAKNQLLNWNNIDLIVLGAGSTIRDQYLCQLSLYDNINIPILIWGSGFDDLLLLTSNRNILAQLRAKDFSSVSFLSSSKLVNSIIQLSEQKLMFGGVRGNYTNLFIDRMLEGNKEKLQNFKSIGEPGLLISSENKHNISSKLWKSFNKPKNRYIMINFGIPTEGESHMYGKNQQSVGAALDLLIKDLSFNYDIILYATHTSDIKHIQALQQIVISMGVLDSRIYVIPFIPDTYNLLNLLSNSSLSITFRYYSAVLSAVAQVPFVSLGYRFKIIEFCDSIGKQDYVISTDKVDFNILKSLVEKALKESDTSNDIILYEKQQILYNYNIILSNISNYIISNYYLHNNSSLSNELFIHNSIQTKNILYIGSISTMNERYIYNILSNYLISYFYKEYGYYCSINQVTAFWPTFQVFDLYLEDYDIIIVSGFRYPHPIISYIYDYIYDINNPPSIILTNSFINEIQQNTIQLSNINNNNTYNNTYNTYNNNHNEIWKLVYPNYNIIPYNIKYPLLLPDIQSYNNIKSNSIINNIIKETNKDIIGIYLSEIQSDFPYSDVSDSLRLISKIIQILQEEYYIIILTSEDNSLIDIQSIKSHLSTINNKQSILSNINIIQEIWDISLVKELLKEMKMVITFSDYSSEISIESRIPFFQIISGEFDSILLNDINLQDLSIDLRQLRSPISLLDKIKPILENPTKIIQDIELSISQQQKNIIKELKTIF